MNVVKLSSKLAVASQPTLDEIAALKHQGYALVINNRPDGEDATQPGTEAERRAADEAGLVYAHQPIGGAPMTEADVRAFQRAVEGSSGPVLAHCRSGTRSLNVWAIGEVLDGRMRSEDLQAFGQSVGIDTRGAQGWLAQHGA